MLYIPLHFDSQLIRQLNLISSILLGVDISFSIHTRHTYLHTFLATYSLCHNYLENSPDVIQPLHFIHVSIDKAIELDFKYYS